MNSFRSTYFLVGVLSHVVFYEFREIRGLEQNKGVVAQVSSPKNNVCVRLGVIVVHW